MKNKTLALVSLLSIACGLSFKSTGTTTRIIQDFAGHEFRLIERDSGYEIQTSSGKFIESSSEGVSPYYGFGSYDLRYLGPGNYFAVSGDNAFNILYRANVDTSKLEGMSFDSKTSEESSLKFDSSQSTTLIPNSRYFEELTAFPNNWFGECGLIAISMLLGYEDTFDNNDFIPNDLTYKARYYSDVKIDGYNEKTLVREENESLVKTANISYISSLKAPLAYWNEMPGTNYSMRDLLFDKYMDTFLNIHSNLGYPMTAQEMYTTLNSYLNNEALSLQGSYSIHKYLFSSMISPYLFALEARNQLNQGRPLAASLPVYISSDSGFALAHDFVIYGYDGLSFIANMGWGPGTTLHSSTKIYSELLGGFISIEYKGEHKHSWNVTMTNGTTIKKVCGCGATRQFIAKKGKTNHE